MTLFQRDLCTGLLSQPCLGVRIRRHLALALWRHTEGCQPWGAISPTHLKKSWATKHHRCVLRELLLKETGESAERVLSAGCCQPSHGVTQTSEKPRITLSAMSLQQTCPPLAGHPASTFCRWRLSAPDPHQPLSIFAAAIGQ